MIVVGYGIAAMIVIVLLVVFNVRAVSKRARRNAEQREPPAAGPEPPQERETVSATVIPKARADTEDQNYRNALRRLKAGETKREPPPSQADGRMSDADYRSAIRKMRNSPDRKE